jgi:hypothetical protein
MILSVNDQSFVLRFRYITKLGKRAELRHGPVRAVTTAVLLASGPRFTNLVAIDNALCSEADNFSRKEGRARAFKKLLDHCGALREFRVPLWLQFHRQFSGIQLCEVCGGEGWMTGSDDDGQACLACHHEAVLGGTGLRFARPGGGPQLPGGVVLMLHTADFVGEGQREKTLFRGRIPASAPKTVLVMPPRMQVRKSGKPTADELALFKQAGEARRLARQQARGGAA